MSTSDEPGSTVTIKDVAELADVSVATVSRVITGAAKVQSARRERVESAMRELGYRPSSLAANLRNQRLQMFGVVVPQLDEPLLAEFVQSMQQAAASAGYGLLVSTTGDVASSEAEQLRELARQRVAGVVLRSCDPAAPEISDLLDLGIPVVAVEHTVRDRRADAVLVDNVEGVRRATQHLIAAGHRRIGFVGGSLDIESDAQRLRGYQAAMREAGLTPAATSKSSRIGGGWLGAANLLDEHDDLTALIAGNGQVALGVLDILRERRLDVPGDLSLLMIDDPSWSDIVSPRVTAFASPIQRIGQSAVRQLQRRLEDSSGSRRQVVYEMELRERESAQRLTTT